jgi:hypothetical protein
MILQDVVLGIVPIVGDLTSVVPAHNIKCGRASAEGIVACGTPLSPLLGLGDESIHLTSIDVRHRTGGAMRTSTIKVAWIVIGRNTLPGSWIIHTHRRHAIIHGNAVSSRIGTEIAIERPVLLHNHDDMFDLVGGLVGWR